MLLVLDLALPIPAAPLDEVQKRILHQTATQSFVVGFCSAADAQEVFQFGNTFQLRSLGSDDVIIGASTLQSCES